MNSSAVDHFPALPRSAIIREVGLRDGMQSIARVMPAAQKIEWIRAIYDAGQREIEVGSFVPARLLPQLADTAELVAFAQTLPGLIASVLVPNLKGAERAMDCGAHAMLVPRSASHAHSLANLRKTPEEVVADIGRMVALRDSSASKTRIEVGLSTRLHYPGPRRARRSAAADAGRAGSRRGQRGPGRHRRLRRPRDGS